MDISFLDHQIAVGEGIWSEERMAWLLRQGVTHILNLQHEFDDRSLIQAAGLTIRWLPTEDDLQPKPAVFFQQVIEFARAALDRPGHVLYVHCTAGVHRGPLAALAILMDRGMSLAAGCGYIRARRPVVDFPEAYLDSLREYMHSSTDESVLADESVEVS